MPPDLEWDRLWLQRIDRFGVEFEQARSKTTHYNAATTASLSRHKWRTLLVLVPLSTGLRLVELGV